MTELELVKKAQAGDAEAMQKLVEDHRRLVLFIASKYAQQTDQDWDDVYQSGMLGLLKAINTLDTERPGSKVSKLASFLIRGEITAYLRQTERHDSRADFSLDDKSLDDIGIYSEDDADDAYTDAEITGIVEDILTTLEPIDADVLVDAYGLTGEQPVGQAELSRRWKCRRERVSKMRRKQLLRQILKDFGTFFDA